MKDLIKSFCNSGANVLGGFTGFIIGSLAFYGYGEMIHKVEEYAKLQKQNKEESK